MFQKLYEVKNYILGPKNTKFFRTEPNLVYAVYQPASNTILTVSQNYLEFFDAQTGERRFRARLSGNAVCAAYNPDLKLIITGDQDARIRVYEVSVKLTSQLIRSVG